MIEVSKELLSRMSLHLRGLADAIDEICESTQSVTEDRCDVDNKSLDDTIPWKSYPARVRRVGEVLSYQILRRRGLQSLSRTYTEPVKTFRDLLSEGRAKAICINGCGAGTIKTLDDEFAARNCPEWLSS